jgi:hypothetical protein
MLLFTLVFIAVFFATLRHLEARSFLFLMPLAMLLFGANLFVGNYYYDRAQARKFLTDLLETEEIQDLEWIKQ